jgi:hypothetical protein
MRRLVYGRRANDDYGLFTSPPAVDAFTAGDADLSFSSMLPHGALVHARGIMTGIPVGGTTVSFPALAYVPQAIIGYYDTANGIYYYFQMSSSAYYAYNPSSGGTVTITRGYGPSAIITPSSIWIDRFGLANWAAHYAILRVPGGS